MHRGMYLCRLRNLCFCIYMTLYVFSPCSYCCAELHVPMHTTWQYRYIPIYSASFPDPPILPTGSSIVCGRNRHRWRKLFAQPSSGHLLHQHQHRHTDRQLQHANMVQWNVRLRHHTAQLQGRVLGGALSRLRHSLRGSEKLQLHSRVQGRRLRDQHRRLPGSQLPRKQRVRGRCELAYLRVPARVHWSDV